ncbi:MAG TPA: hypothetical protein VFJ89_02045 [Nocardioides sp.]|jgi:hypothetical protein|nr:hypothetical protein [Nocardioides sp.]
MRRLATAGAAALAGGLVAAVLALPASADTITMNDPVGDDTTGQGHGDITWVRAHYRAQRLLVTIKAAKDGDVEHFQDLYVDVRAKDTQPDLVISTNGDWEGWSVGFVSDWQRHDYRERCRSKPGSVDYDYAHHVMRYSLPRTCLMRKGADQPQRIRLSLATRLETDRATDWVKAKHTFGHWVSWK